MPLFYILSAVITHDLALLKTSCHFQDAIKKSKFVLSQYNLLQTESQGLAFFSGKTPEHTWHKDLSKRFQFYLDSYLTAEGSVEQVFGRDAQVPNTIPFYLKAIKVTSLNHAVSAIAIFVGKLHHPHLGVLINKVPFEDIKLVPLQLKRHNPETFDQRVQLHNFLCQDSRAIKLGNTSDNF